MNAAAIMREAREAAGLTQVELAELAGTSQTAISAYENDAKRPSLETFDRILAAAGSRLTVAGGAQPIRKPTAAQHVRSARVLADVIALAEALPVRHEPTLRYPRLESAPSTPR